MSKSRNETPSLKVSPSSMVRAPFQRADKRVKNTMRSVPDTLRNAASLLLERVRVGLDIPSRAEVMDLAERISSIAETIEALEIRRNEDSQVIAELKDSAKKSSPARPLQPIAKPVANGDASASSSLAAAAAKLSARPKAKADFVPLPKPTSGNGVAKSAPSKAKPRAKAKAKAKVATTKKKSTATKAKSTASKSAKTKAKPANKSGAAAKKARSASKRKSSN
jgi:cobalamin biosynthesis Mg chelatase CobN